MRRAPYYLNDADKKYIRENRLLLSCKKMAKEIGCGKCLVQRFLIAENIVPPIEIRNAFKSEAMRGITTATKKEDAYIRKNYLSVPQKRIAKNLNRSYSFVCKRLEALGLIIPADVIQKFKDESHFKKGSVPATKGKKITEFMSADAIANSAMHRFKKGNVPHNTKQQNEIGFKVYTNGRSYQVLKTGDHKWEFLHRYNWGKSQWENSGRNESCF